LREQAEQEHAALKGRKRLAVPVRWYWPVCQRASRLGFGAALLVTLLGSLYSFPWTLPSIQVAGWRYLVPAAVGFVFVLSLVNLVFGTSVQDMVRRFEVMLMRRAEATLLSWFG
jgi:hypothetical protein